MTLYAGMDGQPEPLLNDFVIMPVVGERPSGLSSSPLPLDLFLPWPHRLPNRLAQNDQVGVYNFPLPRPEVWRQDQSDYAGVYDLPAADQLLHVSHGSVDTVTSAGKPTRNMPLRCPQESWQRWSITPENFDNLPRREQVRITHVGRIQETEYGKSSSLACNACATRGVHCRIYTNRGMGLFCSNISRSCGLCRLSKRKCSLSETVAIPPTRSKQGRMRREKPQAIIATLEGEIVQLRKELELVRSEKQSTIE
jgi:hypothetical protein